MTDTKTHESAINALLQTMAKLRDPNGGCPWDLEQNFQSIIPYTIEEAYEVADAIERGDMDEFKEELGDLLLQVVFHCQMAQEQNIFSFDDVVTALVNKLVYRHPHVFGEERAANVAEVLTLWDARKNAEKNNKSAIDGVTRGLPALLRAQKLQKKAEKSGFVWPDTDSAWKKLEAELEEFRTAKTKAEKEDELGDVMFCIVNYARMSGMDTEAILTQTNKKFEARFKSMESQLEKSGQTLKESTLDEKLNAWNAGKKQA